MTDKSELKPMTIREAIECSKIFIPFAHQLRDAENGIDLIERVQQFVGKEDPVGLMRAVALMEHASLEDTLAKYKGQGGRKLLFGMQVDFQANPLPDLIEAAVVWGLTSERWANG